MNRSHGLPESDGRLYLRTLGELALYGRQDRADPVLTGVKPLLVPAVLATLPDYAADRAYLAELIWGNGPAKKARGSLRQALHHLTLYGEGAGVLADEGGVWLDTDQLQIDVIDFAEAVRLREYSKVIECYGGPFLRPLERRVGGELQRWIEAQNDRLCIALEVAYAKVVEERLEDGAFAEALRIAQVYADANPLSEKAQLTLIRTLHAGGQSPRALEVFEGFRSLLRTELGGELDDARSAMLERIHEEAVEQPEPTRVVYVENGRAPKAPGRLQASEFRRLLGWTSATAAVTVFAMWRIMSPAPPAPQLRAAGPFDHVNATFLLQSSRGLEDLRVEGESAMLDTTPAPRRQGEFEIYAPDGSWKVLRVPSQEGYDLFEASIEGELLRQLTFTGTYKRPHSLSPDGKELLYTVGEMGPDGRTYLMLPEVLDLETGISRRFMEDTVGESARWSPSGTEIAAVVGTGGSARLARLRPDGSGFEFATPDSLRVSHPVWSPTGSLLAFEYQGDDGLFGVATVTPDGSTLKFVGEHLKPLRWPQWGADDVLGAVQEEGDSSRVWLMHTESGESEQIFVGGPQLRLLPGPRTPMHPWVESVRISPRPALISPGQYLRFDAAVRDSEGESTPQHEPGIEWRSANVQILPLDAEGFGRVGGLGELVVEARLPGWRSDSVLLHSVPLDTVPADILFADDWTDSIRADRWTPFGYPFPYSRPMGGPGGSGVFVSNGDGTFLSGAVTSESLDAQDGLTVEAWVQAPFTGEHWQDYVIGVAADEEPPTDSAIAYWVPRAGVQLAVNGYGATFAVASLHLPAPTTDQEWHRVGIQISREGAVSVVVDGTLFWQGPLGHGVLVTERTLGSLPARVRILLGGQAVGAKIKHGPITVYRGERYVLRAH